ncbi:L-aspartate oxidase [Saccharibacillus sp. O23]|uniref:L-aspartate oxidase n=1 Tax=Saccharibacillus sp. O23 TaxID=2009338 RepID=UPI000B4E79DD|nr:L-aspartate oxidase [Saccharibacillus sp. O23]OWR31988.1 L-aspartate oxidase [Saccharibacillus sp. O23]
MSQPSVLIIGAGAAALSLIDHLPAGCSVRLLTKETVRGGNSVLAQGGIAAVRLAEDSVDSHVQDTLIAGDGHNDADLVREIAAEGSALVNRLAEEGFPFDRDAADRIALGLEGAHSFRRIFHAGGDATGRALIEYLLTRTQGRASVVEQATVLKLIMEKGRCVGAWALHEGELRAFRADAVIIASGGCGSLYAPHTGNEGLTGDGLMLAYEAGAELCDLEFMQFHPTLLVKNGTTYGLISEAVRGEGGVLRDEQGRAIMEGRHPLRDLAPRDIVARAIHEEMRQGREIHLDIGGCDRFRERFPTITGILAQAGIEVESGRIPVEPGMHFMMGGIKADASGSTGIPGLYAIGEAACTGLHGANRLASNSLLEALVTGAKAAQHSFAYAIRQKSIPAEFEAAAPTNDESAEAAAVEAPDRLNVPQVTLTELRRQMSRYASIVRDAEGLRRLEHWLLHLPTVPTPLPELNREAAELARLRQLALLVVRSALLRTESRGAHYRTDCPDRLDAEWSGVVIAHRQSSDPILRKERTTDACSVSL